MCVWNLFVSSSYLLRGIDDSGVVAELQGANHSRADAHHQRKRYLLQDNRETGSVVSGDTGSTVRHDECKGYGDSLVINPGRRSFMGKPPPPTQTRIRFQKRNRENIFWRLVVLYLHIRGKLKIKSKCNQVGILLNSGLRSEGGLRMTRSPSFLEEVQV